MKKAPNHNGQRAQNFYMHLKYIETVRLPESKLWGGATPVSPTFYLTGHVYVNYLFIYNNDLFKFRSAVKTALNLRHSQFIRQSASF